MVHHKINFAAVQGTTSHHIEVMSLINGLSPVSRKRSRHRRLLSLNKTLAKFKIAHSWFNWDQLTIARIPGQRPALVIGIETINIPGLSFPIEYFNITQCETYLVFKTPCSSNFELLKKLHTLNLLSYAETILPMMDLAQQPAE